MISRAVQCPCGLQHPIKEQHTHNTHMPAVDGPHVDFLGDAQFLGLQPRPTAAAGRDGPIHEGEEQDEPLIPVYMNIGIAGGLIYYLATSEPFKAPQRHPKPVPSTRIAAASSQG
eukprot:1143281-Pelagomonas_calceolata.AAC.1